MDNPREYAKKLRAEAREIIEEKHHVQRTLNSREYETIRDALDLTEAEALRIGLFAGGKA